MSTPSSLAALIKHHMAAAGWSLRDLEGITGVSKSALVNILNHNDTVPRLETLVRLARAFSLPLAHLVELCGFDLGLPKSPSHDGERLARLLQSMPQFAPIVDQLVALEPTALDGVLAYLEVIQQRKIQDPA